MFNSFDEFDFFCVNKQSLSVLEKVKINKKNTYKIEKLFSKNFGQFCVEDEKLWCKIKN